MILTRAVSTFSVIFSCKNRFYDTDAFQGVLICYACAHEDSSEYNLIQLLVVLRSVLNAYDNN